MGDYRLYDGVTAEFLGSFASEQAAWRAADEHSLQSLAGADDWLVVEHVVISCGAGGRALIRSELTHVGPPNDVEGCAAWLSALPGRS